MHKIYKGGRKSGQKSKKSVRMQQPPIFTQHILYPPPKDMEIVHNQSLVTFLELRLKSHVKIDAVRATTCLNIKHKLEWI